MKRSLAALMTNENTHLKEVLMRLAYRLATQQVYKKLLTHEICKMNNIEPTTVLVKKKGIPFHNKDDTIRNIYKH